jgi:hypothetical protein
MNEPQPKPPLREQPKYQRLSNVPRGFVVQAKDKWLAPAIRCAKSTSSRTNLLTYAQASPSYPNTRNRQVATIQPTTHISHFQQASKTQLTSALQAITAPSDRIDIQKTIIRNSAQKVNSYPAPNDNPPKTKHPHIKQFSRRTMLGV